MARATRRKYWKRKGKWSANIKEINQSFTATGNSDFYAYVQLTQNPIQSDQTVSQQYTVKNCHLNYEFEIEDLYHLNAFENISAYIMYVPQGMTVDANYPLYHPEYIMAMKWIGSPNVIINDTTNEKIPNYRPPASIRTRLARRLQTGDSIIFLVKGHNSTSSKSVEVSGLFRWWTKAN